MSDSYTGVRVIEVKQEIIGKISQHKEIDTKFDQRYKFAENEYVVLKDMNGEWPSVITRFNDNKLRPLKEKYQLRASSVEARNKEQQMALDALLDDNIKVVVLTGPAGTGKTLLTLAAALQKRDENQYESIILTRPMSFVGKYALGALPGDADDKFMPYLENYICNIEHLMKGARENISSIIDLYKLDLKPLQLIRGASWANKFIIADEIQVLDYDDFVTLGTRVAEESKIIIMGDLAQRDEKIARDKTGIHKFINDPKTKASPLVASIELRKCERSAVSRLFAEVFDRT